MTTALKLRKAVYDRKYPEGIPIERFCEIKMEAFNGGDAKMFSKYRGVNNEGDIVFIGKEGRNIKEILGKPLQLNDLLLALGENYRISGNGIIERFTSDWDNVIYGYDLTKSPEEQDEETIEKLYNLITG